MSGIRIVNVQPNADDAGFVDVRTNDDRTAREIDEAAGGGLLFERRLDEGLEEHPDFRGYKYVISLSAEWWNKHLSQLK